MRTPLQLSFRGLPCLSLALALGLAAPAWAHGVESEAEEAEDDDELSPELAARLGHWAWQRLQEPSTPAIGDTWALGPVDRFVLAGLGEQGLTPAPDADRATWLRRVTFDLTGLPPTTEEVRAFVSDASFDAYERVVDRLLASPHYGERQARHWLDLVRYAETKGHEFDYLIPNAFEYRDYVIRAFEADVPYDQFLVEHVAGDLMPEPRRDAEGANESVLGTGFWQLGSEVHSPVDLKGDRLERLSNQIDVFSRAFMGLTVACARCHDHKADPISQRDFYALAGFLESSRVRQVRYTTETQDAELGRRLEAHQEAGEAGLRQALAADWMRALEQVRVLEHPVLPRPGQALGLELLEWSLRSIAHAPEVDWRRTAVESMASQAWFDTNVPPLAEEGRILWGPGAEADWIADGLAFGSGPRPIGTLRWEGDRVAGVEVLPAARYDRFWDALERHPESELFDVGLTWEAAGRTLHTSSFHLEEGRLFVLSRGGVYVHANLEGHRLVQGPLHGAGKRTWGATDGWVWREIDLRAYAGLRVHLEFTPQAGQDFALAQVIEASEAPPGNVATEAPTAQSLGASLTAWLDSEAQLTTDQARQLDWLLGWPLLGPFTPIRSQVALGPYREQREELESQLQPVSRLAPALIEGSATRTQLATRGNPHTPAGPVVRRFLAALDARPTSGEGSGRWELSQRMIEPGKPFVARVWVNRLWQRLFGQGLVPTVDDLGAMGQPPSHPELLDALAERFQAAGWSTKAMLRELCLSRTYRMASVVSKEGQERDPLNRWLHHMPLRRLDAEALRDGILAFSGGLQAKRFGPPVPIHLNEFLQGRGRPSRSGPVDGEGRRSLYLSVRRNFPESFLTTFDLPTPSTTRGRRSVSNVPAQTLALMNDPFVRGECERLAQSLQSSQDGGAARSQLVDDLVLKAYSRRARYEERSGLLDFLDSHPEPGVPAWADAAQALVLSAEFRFLR